MKDIAQYLLQLSFDISRCCYCYCGRDALSGDGLGNIVHAILKPHVRICLIKLLMAVLQLHLDSLSCEFLKYMLYTAV